MLICPCPKHSTSLPQVQSLARVVPRPIWILHTYRRFPSQEVEGLGTRLEEVLLDSRPGSRLAEEARACQDPEEDSAFLQVRVQVALRRSCLHSQAVAPLPCNVPDRCLPHPPSSHSRSTLQRRLQLLRLSRLVGPSNRTCSGCWRPHSPQRLPCAACAR